MKMIYAHERECKIKYKNLQIKEVTEIKYDKAKTFNMMLYSRRRGSNTGLPWPSLGISPPPDSRTFIATLPPGVLSVSSFAMCRTVVLGPPAVRTDREDPQQSRLFKSAPGQTAPEMPRPALPRYSPDPSPSFLSRSSRRCDGDELSGACSFPRRFSAFEPTSWLTKPPPAYCVIHVQLRYCSYSTRGSVPLRTSSIIPAPCCLLPAGAGRDLTAFGSFRVLEKDVHLYNALTIVSARIALGIAFSSCFRD